MESYKEAMEPVWGAYKTGKLIEGLAKAPQAWTQADIERAIQKTEVSPFSMADIAFCRCLLQDGVYKAYTARFDAICVHMLELESLEERRTYWEQVGQPVLNARHERRRTLYAQFSGYLYYTE